MPVRGLFDARLVGVEARDWEPARTRSMTRSVGGRGWCSGGVAVSVDEAAEDLAASCRQSVTAAMELGSLSLVATGVRGWSDRCVRCWL